MADLSTNTSRMKALPTQDEMKAMIVDKSRELFLICDKEIKGFITKRDMQRLGSELPLSPDQLEAVFDSLDDDGNGFLTLEEFTDGFGGYLGLPQETVEEEQTDGLFEANDVEETDLNLDEDFKRAMETIDASDVLQSIGGEHSHELAREIWTHLKQENQPDLLNRFEDFMQKISVDVRQVQHNTDELENALKSRSVIHDQEVRKLYEEMEHQLKMEKDRIAAEEQDKGKKVVDSLSQQLTQKDNELRELLAQQAKLESKLEHLSLSESIMKEENQQLQKEKDVLIDQLDDTTTNLEEQRMYLKEVKNTIKRDKKERAMHTIKMTQGITSERESLVHQLDVLRDVNKKLQDEKDAFEAESRRAPSLEEELMEASRKSRPRKLVKQGSILSNYFDQPTKIGLSYFVGISQFKHIDQSGTVILLGFHNIFCWYFSLSCHSMCSAKFFHPNSILECPSTSAPSSKPKRKTVGRKEGRQNLDGVEEEEMGNGERDDFDDEDEDKNEESDDSIEVDEDYFMQSALLARNQQLPLSHLQQNDFNSNLSMLSQDPLRSIENQPGSTYMTSSPLQFRNAQVESVQMSSLHSNDSQVNKTIENGRSAASEQNGYGGDSSGALDENTHREFSNSSNKIRRLPSLPVSENSAFSDPKASRTRLSTSGSSQDAERVEPVGCQAKVDMEAELLEQVGVDAMVPERVFKVVFIGDSGVGKTTFLHRFTTDSFKDSFCATIGVDFRIKAVKVENKIVALQLWDTAGQERFRSITKQYFRKADGVVIMYDVNTEGSFLSVRNWMNSVQDNAEEGIVKMMIGNKTDLVKENGFKAVKDDVARKLAESYDCSFLETSAKNGDNVLRAMYIIGRFLLEKEDKEIEKSVNLVEQRIDKEGCCPL
ncbi:EF-hand calcium-binding domain-containing protein 4B-like [Antedon mediterranea]|uniref:EF-hand calcium-binding domain-containing protein 4B-like n=1 Tax=Antedon mediterranea TaxID=105859 RepID=UPI003AF971D6